MKYLKSFIVAVAMLCFSFAQASDPKELEILELQAPSVASLWDSNKDSLILVAEYEAGLFNPKAVDFRSKFYWVDFVMHYRQTNKPFLFEKLLLDEALELKAELLEALSFEGKEAAVDRVLSTKYFATQGIPPYVREEEKADYTSLSTDKLQVAILRDVYAGSYFRNIVRLSGGNQNWVDEYSKLEIQRINPLLLLVPKSHFPEGSTFFDNLSDVGKKHYAYVLDNYFTFPENPEDRPAWYVKNDLSIFSQELMQSVYRTAKKVYAKTKPEDNIVIFGNTPYYIGRALKLMMEGQESKRRVIEFPFSGNPNTIRSGSYPNDDDVATPGRLKHLKGRLEALGFLSPEFYENNHTYILDTVGMGGGIVYTLDAIVDSLIEKVQDPLDLLKNVSIISLNQFFGIPGEEHFDSRHLAVIGSRNLGDNAQDVLTFPYINAPRYKVPVEVMYTPGHAILDQGVDKYPDLLRGFPKYNAKFWHPGYDYLLNKEDLPGRKIFLEHFDTNIRHYIAQGL